MERLPMESLEDVINLEQSVVESCEVSEVEAPEFDRMVLQFLQELKMYRSAGHTPEEIAEFDKLYLAKCEEVNRLNAELAELKKQSQGELISRSALLTKLNDTGVQITFDLPVEETLGEDVDMDDFTMLVQDAIQAYRKMVIDAIQNQPTAYDMEKVVEQLKAKKGMCGHKCCKNVIDIVRNGGKE